MSHVVKVQAAHAVGGFVLAALLPQGIAAAMEPAHQGLPVLAHLHKRTTLSPGNFKDEPLSIEDIELLKHIWADIPGAWPLAIFQMPRACGSHLWENFMRDDYARFGEAFAASALKPDWDVVPAFFDPVETGNSKRLEIRRAHWAELEKAAVDGRIKLFDDIGIPVTKMEIGTKISVADAREYLASVPPGFVLEIIEPAKREWPIHRQADEVVAVPAPVVIESALSTSLSDRPLRMGNSTQERRENDLTPAIRQAQNRCKDPFSVAQVWAALASLADAKERPDVLLGSDETGIKYRKGGKVAYLNRNALAGRLRREKDKADQHR